ncbi:MAG: hypothetical protein MST06_05450 [Firmicutes bacterium]|nr:hypothetical protein [Bacillota bacterium]
MDRNVDFRRNQPADRFVALHPEGVDRNYCFGCNVGGDVVTLHPEGVDRNCIQTH